jgi:two-component system chemotaxis response regulator CheY
MQALVIDDSKTMRIILGRILSSLGFDVADAADGRVGLDLLESGLEPDLILVDWHMPVMTGLQFVEAVRRSPYDFAGRVMLVTTETEPAQIAEALNAGADEYLMKPFDEEAVIGKLRLLGMDV